jgi:hypothetical protein
MFSIVSQGAREKNLFGGWFRKTLWDLISHFKIAGFTWHGKTLKSREFGV